MSNLPPILVAEDEILIRLAIVEALEAGGYSVVEAQDGASALARLEQLDGLQGLVTDIRMGAGPDGWQLAHRARERFPTLPVVYVTGDSAADWAANGVPLSIVLQKPIVSAELVAGLTSQSISRPHSA